MTDHYLACGCRTCGCMCTDHSPTGERITCAPHTYAAVTRSIIKEGCRLVGISAFCAVLLIYVGLLTL